VQYVARKLIRGNEIGATESERGYLWPASGVPGVAGESLYVGGVEMTCIDHPFAEHQLDVNRAELDRGCGLD
jgi:hypothetical protein